MDYFLIYIVLSLFVTLIGPLVVSVAFSYKKSKPKRNGLTINAIRIISVVNIIVAYSIIISSNFPIGYPTFLPTLLLGIIGYRMIKNDCLIEPKDDKPKGMYVEPPIIVNKASAHSFKPIITHKCEEQFVFFNSTDSENQTPQSDEGPVEQITELPEQPATQPEVQDKPVAPKNKSDKKPASKKHSLDNEFFKKFKKIALRILVAIGVLTLTSLIVAILKLTGIQLGGISTAILYGISIKCIHLIFKNMSKNSQTPKPTDTESPSLTSENQTPQSDEIPDEQITNLPEQPS